MLSEDLRDLEVGLKEASVHDLARSVAGFADDLMEGIENNFGKLNEYDVTIANLRLCLKYLIKTT